VPSNWLHERRSEDRHQRVLTGRVRDYVGMISHDFPRAALGWP
jgi:hypothetical protein